MVSVSIGRLIDGHFVSAITLSQAFTRDFIKCHSVVFSKCAVYPCLLHVPLTLFVRTLPVTVLQFRSLCCVYCFVFIDTVLSEDENKILYFCYLLIWRWMIAWVVNEWVSGWVREWVSEWVNEWVSEWVTEWQSDWANERAKYLVSGWMNLKSEWTSERVGGWVTEWENECVREWVADWENEWVAEWDNEWVSECVAQWGNRRVSGWMRE